MNRLKLIALIIVNVTFVFNSFGILPEEAPCIYDESYNGYTFDDWNLIKNSISTKILDGNNGTDIINKLRHASYFVIRLSKMDLNHEQTKVVRSYLVDIFQNYLRIPRFVEYINSSKRKDYDKYGYSIGDDRFAKLSKYKRPDYWLLYYPAQILRTVAILSPSEDEINLCAVVIDTLSDKTLVEDLNLYFAYTLFKYNKENTDIKYMRDILEKYQPEERKYINLAIFIREEGIEKAYASQLSKFLLNYEKNDLKGDEKDPMIFSNAFAYRTFTVTSDFLKKSYDDAANEQEKYFVIIALFRGYVNYAKLNHNNKTENIKYKEIINMIANFLATTPEEHKNESLCNKAKSVFKFHYEINENKELNDE